jgi:hypothetical protein
MLLKMSAHLREHQRAEHRVVAGLVVAQHRCQGLGCVALSLQK